MNDQLPSLPRRQGFRTKFYTLASIGWKRTIRVFDLPFLTTLKWPQRLETWPKMLVRKPYTPESTMRFGAGTIRYTFEPGRVKPTQAAW